MFKLVLVTMKEKLGALTWHPPSIISNVGKPCHIM